MQGLAAHGEREGVAVEGGAMGEDGPGRDVQLLHPQHIGLRDPQQALDGQQLHWPATDVPKQEISIRKLGRLNGRVTRLSIKRSQVRVLAGALG